MNITRITFTHLWRHSINWMHLYSYIIKDMEVESFFRATTTLPVTMTTLATTGGTNHNDNHNDSSTYVMNFLTVNYYHTHKLTYVHCVCALYIYALSF